MMTGKQMHLALVPNPPVPPTARGGRPALLTRITQLLVPADPVRARLRTARAHLDAAMRPAPLHPTHPVVDRGAPAWAGDTASR